MSVFKYSKYKIIIDPKSKKTQGLFVGDIVRRQYKDDSDVIYSLMLVLETGVDIVKDTAGKEQKSHYFIGALLDGSEPTNGQLLDFVRTTNMFDENRGGALYMTASESASPYMDVIDGMAIEGSLCYPYLGGGDPDVIDSRKYAALSPSLVNTSYTPYKDGASRVFRITKNNVAATGGQALGVKQMLPKGLKNPQRVVISYKARASKKHESIHVSLGATNGKDLDGGDLMSVSTDWVYNALVVTIDQPSTIDRRFFINLTALLSKENDWFEIADMNIALLSSLTGFSSAVKTRVGKISGIVDPVFGTIDGYGAYFQNLYASKNINIAGTLTAGDESGFSSTFYVGKIHKNALINSIDFNVLTSNHTLSDPSDNPVGIGKVCNFKTGTSDILAQTKTWLNSKLNEIYSFSFWVKSSDNKPIRVRIKGDAAFVETTPPLNEWHKVTATMTLPDIAKGDLVMSIEVTGNGALLTAPQLESGKTASLYQPTDSKLTETDDYGAWFSRGGIGGTIQNPLLKLNDDGSISSANDSFVINNDGTGHFAGGAIKWTKDKVEFDSSVTMQWTGYTDKQVNAVKGDVNNVKKTADSAVNALGGASFPKLTKITATGIYTGTLTAEQVNAIDINASSIKTGTLSADRIAVGSLKGDKITVGTLNGDRIVAETLDASKIKAGTITSKQINVGNLQAALVTVGLIQGLSLNFTKGKIGAWTINNDGISNENTQLTAAGSIHNTKDAWSLQSNGTGYLAHKNISWDSVGNVSFSDKVKINWTKYTDDAIGDIKIGGTNILENSEFKANPNPWMSNGTHSIVVDTAVNYSGKNSLKCVATGSGDGDKGSTNRFFFAMKRKNLSVFSFFAKADKNTALKLRMKGVPSLVSSFNLTGEWQEYHTPSVTDMTGVICWLTEAATVWIALPMLEDGNIPSSWSPSVHDTQRYLTKIDANGIYTGTLTANQVNAVDINASSIKTGTLSADRIAAGSLNGNKITAGTISADRITAGSITSTQINVASLQASLVTVDHIQGLTISFSKGKIGSWVINGSDITNGTVRLSGNGTIWHTGSKWRMGYDGAGYLASGNISWDASGNVTFADSVKLNWTSYTDSKVSDIRVGARNYIRSTATPKTLTGNNTTNQTHNLYPVSADLKSLGEKVFTTSFDWEATGDNISGSFYLGNQTDTWGVVSNTITLSSSNKSGSSTRTFTFSEANTASMLYLRIRMDNVPVGTKITISNFRMVVGNKEVGWSEAPEDINERVSTAQTGVSGITTALGGTSYPKLTQISATGIYTGTLTAEQVNAVNINASSIKTGTLSADRIAANTLHGNKITSGTITTTQLNVSNIQAALVTVGYIQGLTLNFTKGKIGGWTIENNNLTNGKTKLTAAGSVWHTDNKWSLNADGSGYVASNNIKWDAAGNVTFSGNVQAQWKGYTDNAKQELNAKIDKTDGRITSEIKTVTTNVSSAQSAADNAQKSMDGLKVGGRNYVLKSTPSWGNEASVVNRKNQFHFGFRVNCDDWEVGDTVFVTLYYKYSNFVKGSGAYIRLQGAGNVTQWGAGSFYSADLTSKVSGTSGEIKITHSFTVTSDMTKNQYYSTNIRHDNVSGKCRVAKYKVEIGTKPTDWSPAPEDIDASIAATKTELSTKIDQTASSILIQAKNNAVDEVKAGIKVTAESVTVFGQTMKVDSNLIAKSIEAGNLTVKGGNFQVTKEGIMTAKGANIQGKIESNDSGNRIVIDPTTREFSIISGNGQIVGGFKFDEISGSSFSVMNTAFVDSGNNPLANTDISPFGVTMYDNIGDSKYANMTPSALEIGTNGVSANFKVSISMGRLVVRMKELPDSSLNVQSGELYTTSMNGHKVICQK